MTNKDNDNGLASEVSDAFGSAVQPALGGTFKIFPPSFHRQGVKMDAASKMDRLAVSPAPEQRDGLEAAVKPLGPLRRLIFLATW